MSRRVSLPVSALAIAGLAGSLAVAPLLAGGVAQLSAGLAAMPASVHASVSETEGARRFEPRADGKRLALAEDNLRERLDLAFQASARGDRTGAHPTAPHFADLDPRRFSAQPATEERPPAVEHYAWISGDTAPVLPDGLDRRFASAPSPAALAAVSTTFAIAEARSDDSMSVPLPEPRIATASGEAQDEPTSAAIAMVAPLPERRPAHSGGARKSKPSAALAYASPDVQTEEEKPDSLFGRLFGQRGNANLPGRGSKVAVYDISAATVYMPNGDKLEAHSGLAKMKDNPRYVAEKNRGPTPPNLYDLRMRESRFHGVEAIRLLPADGKKKFNRDGLLAHTYMYVRNGGRDRSQSNGCVVFKDYDRFLKAFKRGEIEHLIVVPHLKEVPTYMAAL